MTGILLLFLIATIAGTGFMILDQRHRKRATLPCGHHLINAYRRDRRNLHEPWSCVECDFQKRKTSQSA
jgi:hypothetical protein